MMIDLQLLADRLGIARDYIDADNRPQVISPECRVEALALLGFSVNDQDKLSAEVRTFREQRCRNLLEEVTVLREGRRWFIYITTPESLSEDASFTYRIATEDGGELTDSCPLEDIEIARYEEIYGTVYDTRRFFVPSGLPCGYHTFSCEIRDGEHSLHSIEMSLIVAPQRCYAPPALQEGRRLWGVSVQLYALRSRHNWGIGDFSDLRDLIGMIGRHGGGFVGLNPIHAGYPANPDPDAVSPYSPSSRKWLNVIYIRVEDVPEYAHCPAAAELVASKSFQSKLRALRDREYVDYRQVLELKLRVLREVYDSAMTLDKRTRRAREFLDFISAGGESLMLMAAYDALQAHFYATGIDAWGWPAFPREYQDAGSYFVSDFIKTHQSDVNFYCYLQFIAQEQLDAACAQAHKLHMPLGIYRDLAVGVPPGSCDVWADAAGVYSHQAGGSIGAPPDTLGPKGQSWGLAPLNPMRVRATRYREYIELYRANMRSCGALRIDHAAGLCRFWVVPPGRDATQGVYIYNDLQAILGILALESQRQQCLVIGEDLGTIPRALREGLRESGIFSYKLFFGERAGDGGFIAPRDYEPVAMAALTTHDMPTLRGWWNYLDLDMGVSLGLYTAEHAEELREDRREAKQQILDSMHGLGSLDDEAPHDVDGCPFTQELADAMQVHMCRGACALYSSQLEDWIGVEKPVNIPGTFRDYPNWRRKLTLNLEAIFASEQVRNLTSMMTKART